MRAAATFPSFNQHSRSSLNEVMDYGGKGTLLFLIGSNLSMMDVCVILSSGGSMTGGSGTKFD